MVCWFEGFVGFVGFVGLEGFVGEICRFVIHQNKFHMNHLYAFEKMGAWQTAWQVIKQIYLQTKTFPKEELFGITSQMRRAGISIYKLMSLKNNPGKELRESDFPYGPPTEETSL